MFNYPVHAVVLANSLNSHVMNYLSGLKFTGKGGSRGTSPLC